MESEREGKSECKYLLLWKGMMKTTCRNTSRFYTPQWFTDNHRTTWNWGGDCIDDSFQVFFYAVVQICQYWKNNDRTMCSRLRCQSEKYLFELEKEKELARLDAKRRRRRRRRLLFVDWDRLQLYLIEVCSGDIFAVIWSRPSCWYWDDNVLISVLGGNVICLKK